MNVKQAYNTWANQYDTNHNRTRDLEAAALRHTLAGLHFQHTLEIGCGTGKNTEWLQTISGEMVAVDFSAEMLAAAKAKNFSGNVTFVQADITRDWDFDKGMFDLITFSLVLEHVEHLKPVFEKAISALLPSGKIYVGELHPFKQYGGTTARFENEQGIQTVTCFNHHVSDFTTAAKHARLQVELLHEYFDENNRQMVPRILTLLFKKLG